MEYFFVTKDGRTRYSQFIMRKRFIYLTSFLFILVFAIEKTEAKTKDTEITKKSECYQLYDEMQLDGIVNYTAFKYAYSGYDKINAKNKDIMTVIDFSKPSTEERFFVLDMYNKKLLYSTHVSHGKKSGENYATSFSNKPGSHKSSPGFYMTEDTYIGRNGYSLVLNGLEKGINDRARERSIVVHGAAYCDSSLIESGRLGRSFGCPALPLEISETIIDTIKDGTLMYIHANDKNYLSRSKHIKEKSLLLQAE